MPVSLLDVDLGSLGGTSDNGVFAFDVRSTFSHAASGSGSGSGSAFLVLRAVPSPPSFGITSTLDDLSEESPPVDKAKSSSIGASRANGERGYTISVFPVGEARDSDGRWFSLLSRRRSILLHRLRRLLFRERPGPGEEGSGPMDRWRWSSLCRGIDWVRPRSARLKGVGLMLFDPLTSEMLVNVGVEGDVTGELGTEGEFALFSCHSRRFSLAQEPHELRYAPARWLTGAVVVLVVVSKVGLRSRSVVEEVAASEGARGGEPVSKDAGGDACVARSSFRLRWASRMASMSAQKLLNTALTFFWPVEK